MKVDFITEPWTCVTVDDFLSPERFAEIKKQAAEEMERFREVGVNTPRGKYVRYDKRDILPEVDKTIMNMMPHREYERLVKLNHWCIMPPNLEYPCHIDNSSRIHTAILYIEPDENVGTILCKNHSNNDNGDHNAPDQDSVSEFEIPWKPNKLFAHNPMPKTWHRFKSPESGLRLNLSVFYADPTKIRPNRQDFDFFIDET